MRLPHGQDHQLCSDPLQRRLTVGYLMTGSVWVGGALALVEPACNTVAFHFHEKVWKRIEARRQAAAQAGTNPVAV